MNEETSDNLAEDYAGLGRIVWDVSGVLDELGEVNLADGEAADLGFELHNRSV